MRRGFKVLDCDAHMQEPPDIWVRYVEPAYRERAPKVTGHEGRTLFTYAPCESFPQGLKVQWPPEVYADVRERYGEAYESWWSLESRLRHMDQEGIDVMVGFPTNGLTPPTAPSITDPQLQAALCRAYNDWATDYCRDSGGRVKFIAKFTMLDVAEAVAEIERIAPRPEAAAVVMPYAGNSAQWPSPEFDPVWNALVAADLAISFHGGPSQTLWFRPWREAGMAAVAHALGFPVDCMLGMGTLIFGGVLERFPALRCGFFEANAGWVPWWLARLDDHATGRQGRYMNNAPLALRPSEYFRRQCFVAADPDEGTLAQAVECLNGDNILFNTDYPHPDAPFPGAVDDFLAQPIPDDAKRKILWDNATAFFGSRLADVLASVPA